jgi:hypothetical protein
LFIFRTLIKGSAVMNLQQWIAPLLKMMQKQNYFGMKRKRNNMWWFSLIGLGISMIALVKKIGPPQSFEANKQSNLINSMKENHVDIKKFLTLEDKSLLAEFSDEIIPKETPKENHLPHQ